MIRWFFFTLSLVTPDAFICSGRKPVIAWAVQMQTSQKHIIEITNANFRSIRLKQSSIAKRGLELLASRLYFTVDSVFNVRIGKVRPPTTINGHILCGAKVLHCFDNRRIGECLLISCV